MQRYQVLEVHYTTWTMNTALLCWGWIISSVWIHRIYVPIFCRVVYDCPNVSETTNSEGSLFTGRCHKLGKIVQVTPLEEWSSHNMARGYGRNNHILVIVHDKVIDTHIPFISSFPGKEKRYCFKGKGWKLVTFWSCYGTKSTSKLSHPPSSEAALSARTPEHAYMTHILWSAIPLSRLTAHQASNSNSNYDIISFDFNFSFQRLDYFFTSWRYYKTIKCQAWHCCTCEETCGKWPWTYLNRRGPPN